MLPFLRHTPPAPCRISKTLRAGLLAAGGVATLHKHMDRSQALPDEAELQHWLRRVADTGDKAAFARLFDHFAPRVKAYLLRLGADDGMAEEILQDVMLSLWRRAGRFDPALASVGTWVFTIARNKRIDALRRSRHPDIDPDDPALVPDTRVEGADLLMETAQSGERLRRALTELPADQADLLKMAYFQDKTHRAIADETSLPLGTVKSRIRLALGRLRTALKDR